MVGYNLCRQIDQYQGFIRSISLPLILFLIPDWIVTIRKNGQGQTVLYSTLFQLNVLVNYYRYGGTEREFYSHLLISIDPISYGIHAVLEMMTSLLFCNRNNQ